MTEGFDRCSLKNFTTPELKECVKQLETGSKGKNKKKEKEKNKHSSHHTGGVVKSGRWFSWHNGCESQYHEFWSTRMLLSFGYPNATDPDQNVIQNCLG
jgi:hypothetical protein